MMFRKVVNRMMKHEGLLDQAITVIMNHMSKERHYLLSMIKGVNNVIRKTGKKVNDEPTFKVIHSYDFWIRNYFSPRTNECCMEVQYDVNEENYIYDATNNNSFEMGYGNFSVNKKLVKTKNDD